MLLFPNQDSLLLTIIRFFGTIGVDLFFVLSGFLIGGIILKQIDLGKTSWNDFLYFWIRRWFRTLPNYFLVLALNVLLLFLFTGEILKGIGNYFLFLQNFSNPQPDFFTESWSLSIEEYAYIIGPLLLFLTFNSFKSVSKKYLFIGITGFVIISSGVLRYQFHLNQKIDSAEMWSSALRKVVIYRIDSIYYGFVLVYVMKQFKSYFKRYNLLLFMVGVILFSGIHVLIYFNNLTPVNTPLFFNVFYLPLISISLLLFFPSIIEIDIQGYVKILTTKLSIISYALYLLNYSVVLLSIQHIGSICEASMIIKIITLLTYWGLSFYLSHLLYTYFEKPMTNLRDKPFFKRILN
ncbi:acyltransferase [Aestuariibaculum sp. L182]|uniref:Acyltransferase n=1 Tax=Aestuariibaculum lutulentum TaxID=2920935 RepID=A0ABS9RE03_9FLAO|nr:acyltransferase [Aestuariibaculum lutulentum]